MRACAKILKLPGNSAVIHDGEDFKCFVMAESVLFTAIFPRVPVRCRRSSGKCCLIRVVSALISFMVAAVPVLCFDYVSARFRSHCVVSFALSLLKCADCHVDFGTVLGETLVKSGCFNKLVISLSLRVCRTFFEHYMHLHPLLPCLYIFKEKCPKGKCTCRDSNLRHRFA